MFIPDDIVEKLHNLDCEIVAKDFDIQVSNHKAHCFMHDDRNPSLAFKRNHWKCFSCGEGGDAISLIARLHDCSFTEACTLLCDSQNIPLPDNVSPKKVLNLKKQKKRIRSYTAFKEEDKDIFDIEVATAIVNFLDLGIQAKHFLFNERKLSPEIIKKMSIKSVESENELKTMLLSNFDNQRLIKAKVLSGESSKLVIDIPSMVIPYYGSNHEIIALQTRYLGKSDYIPRFKMLCNSKKKLYNMSILNEMQENDPLFVMEGITDCLAMLSAGRNAVAIQSATNIPDMKLDKLSDKMLFMVPDSDKAGNNAFDRLYEIFLRHGSFLTRVTLPEEVKDFSEYYMKYYKN